MKPQRKAIDRLSSSIKRMEVLPDAYHAVFHEKNRRDVVELVRQFVVEQFSRSIVVPSLRDADKAGYTLREYDRIRNNGSFTFAVARAGVRIAGRLSRGIGLGWRHGFDSGLSLDYVYKNEPRGSLGVGRLIDKSYL